MNDTFQGTRLLRAVGMTLVLALLVWVPALTQQPGEVSGTVTSAVAGTPIQGVTVRIRGTSTATTTDAQGKYSIAAPPDAVLVFSLIGYRGTAQSVSGRPAVNAILEQAIAVLPDVVVTGYQEQVRKNLPTAEASVDVQSLDRQSGASALQRLDGRVAGVTVENGGSPGSRTTVRLSQLAEPGRHRLDAGVEGCDGGVDLRLAGQQRRRADRNEAGTAGAPAGHLGCHDRRGLAGQRV